MDQKHFALYKIAFGLMDPKTHVVEHTAALEGGIAALFNLMTEYIDCEITDNPNKKTLARYGSNRLSESL